MNRAFSARTAGVAIAAILVTIGLAGPAQAGDLKGRWYFGGNLSFLSTTDDIRNNGAIIVGRPGDDGIPFTGDPNEDQGCPENMAAQNPNLFCDPRDDHLLAREGTIEETFKLDLTAGYGLTSWFSLQLDVSYFEGDVGPVDAFRREALPVGSFTGNFFTFIEFKDFDQSLPTTAARIKEIPVSLTGIVRFRKDSPLNPYVGLGAGIIFAELEVDAELQQLNERLSRLRATGIEDEFGNDLSTPDDVPNQANGDIAFRHPVTIDVEDAFEWHAQAGAEYFFNDRMSMVFDLKYMYADQTVKLDLNGEDQVNYTHFSEGLFREDGSLLIWNSANFAPNPQVDVNGDPIDLVKLADCTKGEPIDLDKNGKLDVCYDRIKVGGNPSKRGATEPLGVFLVQGGEIDLTGFSVAVGVRWHF